MIVYAIGMICGLVATATSFFVSETTGTIFLLLAVPIFLTAADYLSKRAKESA
jgi:tetrahydromethanopterin S-methyltransferase subunit C